MLPAPLMLALSDRLPLMVARITASGSVLSVLDRANCAPTATKLITSVDSTAAGVAASV